VNAPLDFELQSLDPKHPYLYERGFTDETIEHFGTGFCNRGMLKGRIAIPLHDPQGQLVGYAGRITRDDLVSEKCPKYLFPGERDRKGILLEFRKSLLLYNAHRIEKPVDHLFVVEGLSSLSWARTVLMRRASSSLIW
jgi:DNA primase